MATDRSYRNAMRRLERVLSNETYGPKLARLSPKDSNDILRLIEENKGREARAEILARDQSRREHKNPLSGLRQRAVANMLDHLPNASERTVRAHVQVMTRDALELAATGEYQSIAAVSRLGPLDYADEFDPDWDEPYNPFWYHD